MTKQPLMGDPEIADIRPGDEQDWAALERYLREIVDDLPGDAMQVRQFPNGSANLTYLVMFGEHKLVVRRPPRGAVAAGAHEMGREFRVLSRLWSSYPRAPRALAYCDRNDVLDAPFLVIEYRSGAVIRSELPTPMRHRPHVGAAISNAFVEAVADLHLVDPDNCDLGELGRPTGFAERQLRGWRMRWHACRPDGGTTAMDKLADLLERDIPEPSRVSLVHNDLKLDNCQFAPDDPTTVRTVFDWDMTTLGDPLIDLGTLLSYWPTAGHLGAAARQLWPGQDRMGLWSRAQLCDAYAELTGLDVSRIHWYEAFGGWKTAVALQQLANRALHGHTQDERLAHYADIVPIAATAAMQTLESS